MNTCDQARFDSQLDEHLAVEYADAASRTVEGDIEARRPDALRVELPFSALRVGDYITAETGVEARWVTVSAIENGRDGQFTIGFTVPVPQGLGMHTRYTMTRDPADLVVVDGACRGPEAGR